MSINVWVLYVYVWGIQCGDDFYISKTINIFKTSVEVPAPFAGKIVEFLVEDGAKVTAKQKLYKLEKDAESGDAAESPKNSEKEQPEEKEKHSEQSIFIK